MTAESSERIMDTIFAAKEEEGRARLLRIIQEFLFSEAGKHSAKEKGNSFVSPTHHALIRYLASTKSKPIDGDVNMEELVGNTDGFADSGYVFDYVI